MNAPNAPPTLAQQIAAVEAAAAFLRTDRDNDLCRELRAAVRILRKVQSGEYVLEDELLECDAPAPGAADGAEREGR